MTDEQINIAIAESMGWKNIYLGGLFRKTLIGCDPNNGRDNIIPKYTADLNACREMVNHLTNDEYVKYSATLLRLVGSYTRPRYHDAEAIHRCEAYLRTIGKWRDADHA